jgi:dihydroxyacetone kinase
MKKFLNRPENAVEEMLQGLVVLSPGAVRLRGHNVMIRADAETVRDQQVAVFPAAAAAMSQRMRATLAPAC